jgi:hypothetical protein
MVTAFPACSSLNASYAYNSQAIIPVLYEKLSHTRTLSSCSASGSTGGSISYQCEKHNDCTTTRTLLAHIGKRIRPNKIQQWNHQCAKSAEERSKNLRDCKREVAAYSLSLIASVVLPAPGGPPTPIIIMPDGFFSLNWKGQAHFSRWKNTKSYQFDSAHRVKEALIEADAIWQRHQLISV